MIKIVNHPGLLGVECTWNDSGKFLALGELFEQLGFTEEDSLLQNKVNYYLFRLSFLLKKNLPLI
jgi:hypothetical protein